MFPDYSDTPETKIGKTLDLAEEAFLSYRNSTGITRAEFLKNIARELQNEKRNLISAAEAETSLGISRLDSEFQRTVSEIFLFADLCQSEIWQKQNIQVYSNTKISLLKDGIRNIPIGPVVVIGACNFPFAISVVGTDTISALAVGCTVVVKSHPGHSHTCQLLGELVEKAGKQVQIPKGTFQLLHGENHSVTQKLVSHPKTACVAFTGSLAGGRALFEVNSKREKPVPFHAEMGSLNPVIALPNKILQESTVLASKYLEAVTLFGGQMCTKPGALFLIDSSENETFFEALKAAVNSCKIFSMLNEDVYENFENCIADLKEQHTLFASNECNGHKIKNPAFCRIFDMDSVQFLKDSGSRTEAFGPASLLVRCKDKMDLMQCIDSLDGSLTGSIHASKKDYHLAKQVLLKLEQKVGRLIWNGFPPGVIPGLATHHGGPWPATTDSRFTSIGREAYKRFIRPVKKSTISNDQLL